MFSKHYPCKKDRMSSCRMNQIQWIGRQAERRRVFEGGLDEARTSTNLEASLILSSMRSTLFGFGFLSCLFQFCYWSCTLFWFLPGEAFEGRSIWEPHDARFPFLPLPRMREICQSIISGMLSPASIHSIAHIWKKWPSSFWSAPVKVDMANI